MVAKPPTTRFVFVPRMWPTFAIATAMAVVMWALALIVGHPKAFLLISGVSLCTGMVLIAFSARRKVRLLPLALPSPEIALALFRAGIGACWGAVWLAVLVSKWHLER